MDQRFQRTEMMLGKEAMERLNKSHVAIFGIGGVGGYVLEALVRSGVGKFTIIDNDVIDITNINRQIIALDNNIGKLKVDAAKERVISINPQVEVFTKPLFVNEDTINEIDFNQFDYVIDAIDFVKGKVAIIAKAKEFDKPIISSLGAGNKMNLMGFIIADINKTEVDPLAKAVRYRLRQLGINKVKVAYSKEQPVKSNYDVPMSNSFVPPAMGLLIASEVIKDLIK